jgi:hypothetical protein
MEAGMKHFTLAVSFIAMSLLVPTEACAHDVQSVVLIIDAPLSLRL